MADLFPWVLTVALLLAAYPLARWLLRRSPVGGGRVLVVALTLAIGPGVLTLILFWQMLLGLRPGLASVVFPYLVLMAPFALSRSLRRPWCAGRFVLPNWSPGRMAVTAAVIALGAGILFNAVYWPFHGDDVLGIYGRYGRLMADTRALVPFAGRDDAFYQAYPIHVPLLYTFAFITSGWENDYLARLFSALLSLGSLLAAYELGRHLYSERSGWLAMVLLALTPTFARWASSGYVDLPMAFLFTLAAVFAWRWRQGGGTADALLTGVLLGLAAWTKNAALMGAVFVGIWVAAAVVRHPGRWRQVALMAVGFGLIATPWYARNWVEAGLIVPPTAWTDQAQRTLQSLLVFIVRFENYSVTGWIVTTGVVWACWQVVRRQADQAAALLLVLTVPFFGAWWLLVSYDPRFLLLFLPMLCVLGGQWLGQVWDRWSTRLRWSWALAAGALLLLGYNLWISVEYKPAILREPLMSDTTKREIVTQGGQPQSNQR